MSGRACGWLYGSAFLAGGAVLFCLGCAAPGGPGGPGVEKALFTPLPTPPDFDRQRAGLALAEIPDDPPPPAAAGQAENAELPQQAREHLAKAERLFAEQRFSETVAELEKALRYQANNHRVCHLAALVHYLLGNDEQAKVYAERALTIKPDDLAGHYVLGRVAEKARQAEEALRAYRLALKCPPAKDDAYRTLVHYYLGVLLDQQGYYRPAIEQLEAFEAAVESGGQQARANPELAAIARVHRWSAAIRIGRAHELLGQYAEAAGALRRAIKSKPDDVSLRANLVRLLVLAGQVEPAAGEAARLVAETKGHKEAVKLLLAVHLHAGRPERGLQAVQAIIAQQPDNMELALVYAEVLAAMNRHEQAATALADLVNRFPQSAEPRWKLIELHRLRRRWPLWLQALVKELTAQPADYGRVVQELGRLDLDTANNILAEAEAHPAGPSKYLPAAPAPDESAALDCLFGYLCDRLERIDAARAYFQRSRRDKSEFLPAVVGEAQLYIKRCRWHEAIEMLQAAEKKPPVPGGLLPRLLGQCYDGLDEVERAADCYKKAIELNRTDASAMMLLGRLYERTNTPAEARRQYQAAVAADPDAMEAREALVQSYLGQLHELMADDGPAAVRKQLITEIKEMQERAPGCPASVRSTALFRFLLLSGDKPDRATYLDTLRKLVQEYPEDLRSREMLATTLFTFQDYPGARREAEEILRREPYSAPGNELSALTAIRLLEFEAAAQRLQRLLEWYPNRAAWMQTLANLRVAMQDYDGAIACWQRLLALKGSAELRLAYQANLLQVYRLARRFEPARAAIQTWLGEAQRTQRRWYMQRLFILNLLAEDYAKGIEHCRRWLADDPKNADFRNWLLMVLEADKRYDEAVLQTLEWLRGQPDNTLLIEWLVRVLQSAGRHEGAIELARAQVAVINQPEQRAAALDGLCDAYVRAKRYDEAIAIVKELLALEQKATAGVHESLKPALAHRQLAYNEKLGMILRDAKRYDEAIAHYQDMIRQAPTDAAKALLLARLAYVYQYQGRKDQGLQRLREAYALAPTNVTVNNDLGYTLAEQGLELDEAERMCRFAVGEEFLQAAYLDSLGWVLYKRGQLEQAHTWLARASALEDGEDLVIYDHLGDVYWRLGRGEQAAAAWRRALRIQAKQADEESAQHAEVAARIKSKLEALTAGRTPAVAAIPGKGEE